MGKWQKTHRMWGESFNYLESVFFSFTEVDAKIPLANLLLTRVNHVDVKNIF